MFSYAHPSFSKLQIIWLGLKQHSQNYKWSMVTLTFMEAYNRPSFFTYDLLYFVETLNCNISIPLKYNMVYYTGCMQYSWKQINMPSFFTMISHFCFEISWEPKRKMLRILHWNQTRHANLWKYKPVFWSPQTCIFQ